MPPMQSSIRGSLLTGASAFALSVSGGGAARAQAVLPPPAQPTWLVWVEGVYLPSGGSAFNIPTLPQLTPPYMSFTPGHGSEVAAGFDYHAPGQAWHFVFDVRGGFNNWTTKSENSQSSFFTVSDSYTHQHFSTDTQTAREHERHFETDFMIGRDFGLGLFGLGQLQFGVRLADLNAQIDASQQHFFSTAKVTNPLNYNSAGTELSGGAFKSRFFGAGPRFALVDTMPLGGFWSIDFGAGAAALFGYRSLDAAITTSSTTTTTFSGTPSVSSVLPYTLYSSTNSTPVIFNADGWAALSYAFTSNYKLSAGIRSDYYANALTTYNVNGGTSNVSRNYWGPFLRFTGQF